VGCYIWYSEEGTGQDTSVPITVLLCNSPLLCSFNVGINGLRKDDDDWVRRCLAYAVEDARPRGRPKKTWKEVVDSDLKCLHLCASDALDHENGVN